VAGQTFILKIQTPREGIFDDEVESVILPGAAGSFEVRARHARLVSILTPGHLCYSFGGKTFHFACGGGFAEVHTEGVTVLVDSAEPAAKIDTARAEAALQRAKEQLKKLRRNDSAKAEHWRGHLQRAENRVRVAKRYGDRTPSGS
jgi:F-type H+-transporting ATPase subunit epsilon